jgi:hypothetical protein
MSGPSVKNAHDLVPGWFSDYSWYIVDNAWRSDDALYQTFDRPIEMAAAYRAVQKYMKRNGCRSRDGDSGKLGPWVLGDAETQWVEGVWLRQGNHRFVPQRCNRPLQPTRGAAGH